jgi:uncharacterized RDD family membrane protein YckC
MTTFAPPLVGNVRVTGRRVLATVIDLLVISLAYRVLTAPLHLSTSPSTAPSDAHLDAASRFAANLPSILTYAAIAGVYYVALEATWARTLGKRLTGIRVVTQDGGKPGLWPVLLRTVFRVLDSFGGTYLVGFLVTISSPRRQRLGDIVAKTQVIRA